MDIVEHNSEWNKGAFILSPVYQTYMNIDDL